MHKLAEVADKRVRVPAGSTARRPKAQAAAQSCEACGAQARLHVLEGYRRGSPVIRAWCLACADTAAAAAARTARRRLRLSTMLGLVAFVLLVIGLFGDMLIPPRHAGFGLRQGLGVGLGLAVFLSGLLLRADLVLLAGALLGGAALSADWFGLTSGAGIGPKQRCLISIGVLLLLPLAARGLAALRRRRSGGAAPAAHYPAADRRPATRRHPRLEAAS